MEKIYLLLFISCLSQLIAVGNAKRTEPSITLDIPLDFHQRVKVYDDFIEIIQAPSQAGPEFDIVLSYKTKDKRLLTLKVTSIGIQNTQHTEFKYSAIIAHRSEVTQTFNVKVHLRDSLAYLENKALGVFPDLYIEQVHVTVTLLDVLPGGLDSKPVLAGDFLRLPLIPPWSRPQKPGFSYLWPWENLITTNKPKIKKCRNLNGKHNVHIITNHGRWVGISCLPTDCLDYPWPVCQQLDGSLGNGRHVG